MSLHIIKQDFFDRPTLQVAQDLLGKFLVRRYRGKTVAYMITEVEAYDGLHDKASHASRGKTARNAPMFGPAGYWYVYFTYGMHWMLNIVTRKEGYPSAVLIRGVCPVRSRHAGGAPACWQGRATTALGRSVSNGVNGPGRLTKKLHIDKKLNGKLANRKSGLWVAASEDLRRASPIKIGAGRLRIKKSPRIGVNYAGPVWAKKPWRFSIAWEKLSY